MKKRLLITTLILAILACFLTVGVFATEDNISSEMPFVVEDEDIMPEYPVVESEDDALAYFEEIFGENGEKFFNLVMVGATVMSLFFPLLIVVIVFGVLNRKTKKKIKEYEKFFGPVPQNAPNAYNPSYCNTQAYQPYSANSNFQQPTGSAQQMGCTPAGNYVPQGNNNQQGGSF